MERDDEDVRLDGDEEIEEGLELAAGGVNGVRVDWVEAVDEVVA
jgi:hypothetical protein